MGDANLVNRFAHVSPSPRCSDEEKQKIVDSLDPRPPPEEEDPQAPLKATLQPGIPFDVPVGKNISSDIGLQWFKEHKNETEGVKIMVALGGWTWSQNFASVAANETKRSAFAESVKGFLDEWELDGIGMSLGVTSKGLGADHTGSGHADIDWEYPTAERVNGSLAGESSSAILTIFQD